MRNLIRIRTLIIGLCAAFDQNPLRCVQHIRRHAAVFVCREPSCNGACYMLCLAPLFCSAFLLSPFFVHISHTSLSSPRRMVGRSEPYRYRKSLSREIMGQNESKQNASARRLKRQDRPDQRREASEIFGTSDVQSSSIVNPNPQEAEVVSPKAADEELTELPKTPDSQSSGKTSAAEKMSEISPTTPPQAPAAASSSGDTPSLHSVFSTPRGPAKVSPAHSVSSINDDTLVGSQTPSRETSAFKTKQRAHFTTPDIGNLADAKNDPDSELQKFINQAETKYKSHERCVQCSPSGCVSNH